jgi:hypothetical protein
MKERPSGDLLSDLVIKDGEAGAQADAAGLLVEPESDGSSAAFKVDLDRSLSEAQSEVVAFQRASDDKVLKSWELSRTIVADFQPVPWFIWRLSNSVFSAQGQAKPLTDGGLIGLRRLVFAAASDPFLGAGKKVNSIHRALEILPPDVIASVAVIHAVCRRLATCQFERIWRPILDDALLRAQIGFLVGERKREFGAGRGMLAGFAGRVGLAILIASGELDQARRSLEGLAAGKTISDVGMSVYGADPLQISAMTLSAAGCGRDAAFGTVRYSSPMLPGEIADNEQFHWLSAFTITECIRTNRPRDIKDHFWDGLGYVLGQDRGDLIAVTESMLRRGHTLPWIC